MTRLLIMGIEGNYCQEAIALDTAAAHAFEEGYTTVEKQGEVA